MKYLAGLGPDELYLPSLTCLNVELLLHVLEKYYKPHEGIPLYMYMCSTFRHFNRKCFLEIHCMSVIRGVKGRPTPSLCKFLPPKCKLKSPKHFHGRTV